ncbi:MAG: DNA-3-methyladenine glycosylase I [Candidatus Paceibacterota bacterium]
MSYCQAIKHMEEGQSKELHKNYHDNFYGVPIYDDNELFGRLVLEINQAGLSWTTILKKEPNFRQAYHNFNIKKVAAYTEADRVRLMGDAGIVRHRLKINAAIENAKTIILIQTKYGSFRQWLDQHQALTKEEWTRLFKQTFKFTGGEIVGEFLMSIGLLPGAHDAECGVGELIVGRVI